MKVEITRTTIASGERVVKGKTYDLSDKDAKYLIGIGKAKKPGVSSDKKSDKESEK